MTIIIAASNSSASDKARATVVTGTTKDNNLGQYLTAHNPPSGSAVELVDGDYKWHSSSQSGFALNSNVTITGTANTKINANWGEVSSSANFYGITVNANSHLKHLHFRGRIEIMLACSNSTFDYVDVDQSTDNDLYQGLMGLQAGWFFNTSCSNVTFNNCSARKTWHHGWTTNREGITLRTIRFNDCNIISCGSGLVATPNNRGSTTSPLNSRWSTGMDLLDSSGNLIDVVLNNVTITDSYQSGFHIDGSWEGHEQNIDVTFNNCKAIGCGVRSFIAGYQYASPAVPGVNISISSQPPDLYSSGFYVSKGVKLNNCYTQDCARAGILIFEGDSSTQIKNCHDKGSAISLLLDAGSSGVQCDNFIAEASKYHALVFSGPNHKITNFKIANYNPIVAGKKAIIFGINFVMRFCLAYEEKNLQSSDGPSYNSSAAKNKYYYSGTNNAGVTLSVQSNQSFAGQPILAMAWTRSNASNQGVLNSAIGSFTDIPVTPIEPIPIQEPTTNCDELKCENGIQYRWDCPTKTFVVTGNNATCVDNSCKTRGELDCKNGIQYVCGSDLKWKSLNRTCRDTPLPTPTTTGGLNKTAPTRINAKDFDKGGEGAGYHDTTPQNEGGAYRTSEGVDLATWQRGTDVGSTVVAYTADTEWLAYTLPVEDTGSYSIKFRTSTPNENCMIRVYVNDETTGAGFPIVVTADYATFVDSPAFTIPSFLKSPSTLRLEFLGDMNLNWFELAYISGSGDDKDGQNSPHPVDIQYEFEGKIKVNSVWYDIGGEGVGYHKETPDTETNDRGDPITTISANNDQKTAIIGNTGDWLQYTLNIIDSESYNIDISAGSKEPASTLRLIHGGTDLCAPIAIGNTNGIVKRFTAKVNLSATHIFPIRVLFNGKVTFEMLEFYGVIIPSGESFPYRGEGKPFKMPVYANDSPLVIEAEYFNRGDNGAAYADDTVQNLTNEVVRDQTSVDIYTNRDYTIAAVDWTSKKEWLSYSVNIEHILAEEPSLPPEQQDEKIYSMSECGSLIGYIGYDNLFISTDGATFTEHELVLPTVNYTPYLMLGKTTSSVFKFDSMTDWWMDDEYVMHYDAPATGDATRGKYISSFKDMMGNVNRLYEKCILDFNGNEITHTVTPYAACSSGSGYILCTNTGVYDNGVLKSNMIVRQIENLGNGIIIGLANNRIFRSENNGLGAELISLTTGTIKSIYYNRKTNTSGVLVNDSGNVFVYYSRVNGAKGTWKPINTYQTGEGTAFCITDSGKVWVSFEYTTAGVKTWDVLDFALPESPVNMVAGSDGSSSILHSTNGTDWIVSPSGLTKCFNIAFNGSIWVAVGDGTYPIYSSLDGVAWVGHTVSGVGIGHDVMWTGETFIVVGTGSVAYSKDGLNWVTLTGVTGWKIATDGKTIIVVGSTVYKSLDNGLTWSSISSVPGGYAVATNGMRWVIGGKNGHGLWYSNDTINWVDLGNSVFTACYGIAYNGHQWVGVGDGNYKVAYSNDGISWNGVANTFTAGYGVSWVNDRWIATGIGTNKMLSSFDGIVWNPITSNVFGTVVNGITSKNEPMKGEYWNTHSLPSVVAVGKGIENSLATSISGVKWNGLGKNIFTEGFDVIYDGTTFFAVGSGDNSLAISTDGINWNPKGKTIMQIGRGITYKPGKYIIVGYDPINTISYSTNGDDWNGCGKTTFDVWGYGVTWDGTKFIAVGSGSVNTIATSTDGIAWSGKGKTYLVVGYSIATNGTSTIAVGIGGMVITSDHGETWSTVGVGLFDVVYGIAHNGVMWVAVGHGNNSIATSINGTDWVGRGNEVFANGRTITWNGETWIVGGDGERNSLAYSNGGV